MDLSHQLYSLNLNHYMDSVLQHQLFFQVLLYVHDYQGYSFYLILL